MDHFYRNDDVFNGGLSNIDTQATTVIYKREFRNTRGLGFVSIWKRGSRACIALGLGASDGSRLR